MEGVSPKLATDVVRLSDVTTKQGCCLLRTMINGGN